jgi:glycosyltransferase involved in cell wall biosynthesis
VVTAVATIGASRTEHAEARGADSSRLFRVDEPPRPAPPRRVRVVHCIDGLGVGGTELNMVRTLEHLDRERVEATVVALNAEGPLRPRLDATGLAVHAFPIPNLYGPRAMRQLARLAAHLRSVRADVVHCHDMYTNAFGVAAARLAGVPLVIASRRWWTALPSRAHALANRAGYRLAHRVLANSDAVGRLVEAEGVPRGKVFVLPNFLEDAAFAPMSPDERSRVRSSLGVPPGATVVGLVARLSTEKRVDVLLRAFARLGGALGTAHLVVVGDGGERPALEALARDLGIADRTHFAGQRPNRPNSHALFDLSVLCSDHEGFPNSVVEAMAAGRPVVATAVGGVPDAVVDGATGLLVPPGDLPALSAAIAALLADADRREGFGCAGRERARACYHERMVIPKLVTLYESSLQGS